MAETAQTLEAVSRMGSRLQQQMDAQASKMEGRMDDMRAELRRELGVQASQMTDLHSQNQLLLSKISALSSQNTNAPGIFEGADKRKLAQKQAQLRKNGQKVTPGVRRRQLAFFVSLLPPPLPVNV